MLRWENDQVLLFLKNRHHPDAILDAFREHNVTGLTLPMLTSADLKEMGITNLRQRLEVLRDISEVLAEKQAVLGFNNVEHPLLAELETTIISSSLIRNISKNLVDEAANKLTTSAESAAVPASIGKADYHALASKINKLREEILPVLKGIQDAKPLPSPMTGPHTPSSPLQNNHASKRFSDIPHSFSHIPAGTSTSAIPTPTSASASASSSTPSATASPAMSHHSYFPKQSSDSISRSHSYSQGHTNNHTLTSSKSLSTTPTSTAFPHGNSNSNNNSNNSGNLSTKPSLLRKRSSGRTHLNSNSNSSSHAEGDDTLKQLRAKTEDPCYKIIQAAMRSHRLDRSAWRNYVLVICYGGDKERVLRYDEKPVVVFKELNELGLTPSMMLRQVEETDDTGDAHGMDDYETPGGRL